MCLPSQLSRAHYPLLALLFLLSCTILASYLPPLKCNSHPTHLPKEFNNPIPKTFFPSNKTHPTLLDEAHLTRNGGFLMLRKTPSAPPIGYGISMLHQAHCVDMLRAALFGGPHEHTLHFRRDTPRAVDSLDDEHLEHCLDYIAQVSGLYGACGRGGNSVLGDSLRSGRYDRAEGC
ncbi:hypothetical protein BDV28DRAFT_144874 [Aspergillus coremiiformis]|uniref:Oxidase ustYa n=1 Tax=Aspergillus coremiiformis TaxID=138285 RepID=A0A5N6ZHS5_9EURO|nr:hypothetical protein BDV28DRAFT_144874 [Aspergillus coremiiformis]